MDEAAREPGAARSSCRSADQEHAQRRPGACRARGWLRPSPSAPGGPGQTAFGDVAGGPVVPRTPEAVSRARVCTTGPGLAGWRSWSGPTLFALDGAGGAAGLGDAAGGMVARGLVDQQGQGFEQRRSELVSPVCVHGAASVTVGAFAARSAKIRCRPRHGRRAGVAGRARSVRMESAMFRSSFWGAGAQCAQ